MKIQLFVSNRTKQTYWHIRARNGKLCAASEGYTTRAMAIKTVRRIFAGTAMLAAFEAGPKK